MLCSVTVKHLLSCHGDRGLFLPHNPIIGEQIPPVQRGLRALRPGGVLVIGILVLGKPRPDNQDPHAYEQYHTRCPEPSSSHPWSSSRVAIGLTAGALSHEA